MTWTRITIIVTAENKDIANDLASVIDPDVGGSETFTAAYSQNNSAQPTHYVSSGLYSQTTAPLILGRNADTIFAAASSIATARSRSFTLSKADISLVLESSLISTDDPSSVIGSIGLEPTLEQRNI